MTLFADDFPNLPFPRRKPIYIVASCSASRAGEKIRKVEDGIQLIYQTLMNQPEYAEYEDVSLITFSDRAYKTPPVPVNQFTPPKLVASGGACLGEALVLLAESLEHDIIPFRIRNVTRRTFFEPFAFIVSDGMAMDHWQSAAKHLKEGMMRGRWTVTALAVGEDADLGVLHQIADTVILPDEVTPETVEHGFSGFFFWDDDVYDFGQTDPEAFAMGGSGSGIFELPEPPPGLLMWREEEPKKPVMPTVNHPRVFVSHSHADDAFTKRLVGDLRAAGADVWVDDTTIRDGNFAKHISDGLDKSDYLVLVLTPHAIASDWVQEEVFTAITLVKQRRMRAVIPVLAAACDPQAMPSVWGSLHRYDATKDYPAALAGLLRALGLPGSS